MAHGSAVDDFDWVAAQSKCSAAAFYERLKAGLALDVERRNALTEANPDVTFEYYDDDEGHVEVTRNVASRFGQSKVTAIVRFVREGRHIEVAGEDIDVLIHAVVSLDPEGHCRVVIGEVMYSEWEFRRMALEQLFFPEDVDLDEP